MPFSPNLPAQVQPMQRNSPFETFSEMMRAKQSIDAQRIQKQQERMGQIKIEDAERDRRDDDQFRDLTQKHLSQDGTPNWLAISRAALASGNFSAATKAQTSHDSSLRAADAREAADLKRVKDGVSIVGGLFRAAQRAPTPELKQQAWTGARNVAIENFGQEGPGPDGKPMKMAPKWLTDIAPEQYNDQAAEVIGTLGMTVDQELNLLEFGIKKRAEAMDLMNKGGQASDAQHAAAAPSIYLSSSPQDLATVAKTAMDKYGAPQGTIDFFLGGKKLEEITPEDMPAIKARAKDLLPSKFFEQENKIADRKIAQQNANTARMNANIAGERLSVEKAKGLNDPTLPVGVKEYVASLPGKMKGTTPYTLADAQGEIRRNLSKLQAAHPGLDTKKVFGMIDAMYGKTNSLMDFLGGGADTSAETPVAPGAPAVVQPSQKGFNQPPAGAQAQPAVAAPQASAQRTAARAILDAERTKRGRTAAITDAQVDAFLRMNPSFSGQ